MNQIQQKIYTHILDNINDGVWSKGEKITPEETLRKDFATTRMNVRCAVAELKRRGILVSNKKQGTLVAASPSKFELGELKKAATRRLYVLNGCPEGFRAIHWNEQIQNPMQAILDRAGIECEYFYTDTLTGVKEYKSLLQNLTQEGCNAILLIPRNKDDVLFRNIDLALEYQKHIFVYNRGIASGFELPVNSVSIDAFNDSCMTGMYLLEKGYTNLAFCFTNKNDKSFWARNVVRGIKLSIKRSNRKDIDFQSWRGRSEEIGQRLMDCKRKFAIIPFSYKSCIDIAEYLSGRNFHARDDYGIFAPGAAENSSHRFTGISYSFELIGKRLGKMIAENIDHESKEIFCVKVESKIIENNTC